MHISDAENILNKLSGWKALTGTTDFGKISSSDSPECKLAFDLFLDRIVGYIGCYYVSLEGQVDALVFAGGIGEKGKLLRSKIIEKCRCLGFTLDEKKNEQSIDHVVQDLGKEGAKHQTLVCQTDEQVRQRSKAHSKSKLTSSSSSRWPGGVRQTLSCSAEQHWGHQSVSLLYVLSSIGCLSLTW